MLDLLKLHITDHFIEQCEYRAPWLFCKRSKKQIKKGLDDKKIDTRALERALSICEEVKRPDTIKRMVNNDSAKYFCTKQDYTTLSRMLVFVVDNDRLLTVYKCLDSWANKDK